MLADYMIRHVNVYFDSEFAAQRRFFRALTLNRTIKSPRVEMGSGDDYHATRRYSQVEERVWYL